MADVVVMEMLDRGEQLLDDLGGFLFRDSVLFLQIVIKLTTTTKLHHHVEIVLIHIHLIEIEDVRVVYLQQDLQLVLYQLYLSVDARAGYRFHSESSRILRSLALRLSVSNSDQPEISRPQILAQFIVFGNVLVAYATNEILVLVVQVLFALLLI
jgi:hypothetical protein